MRSSELEHLCSSFLLFSFEFCTWPLKCILALRYLLALLFSFEFCFVRVGWTIGVVLRLAILLFSFEFCMLKEKRLERC